MKKYLILFNASVTAKDLQVSSTPEQVRASMDAWIAWKAQAEATVGFEFGMPVQAVGRVTPQGTIASDNPAGGYAFITADSETAVFAALASHPQLQLPAANIDVLEVVTMEQLPGGTA